MRVPNSSSSCSASWLRSLSKSLPTLTVGFLDCKLGPTTLDLPTYGINRRFSDPIPGTILRAWPSLIRLIPTSTLSSSDYYCFIYR